MSSISQILLISLTFFLLLSGGSFYIYYFRLGKIPYDKILLYLSAGLKLIFISAFIISAVYLGKLVRFYGGYSVMLLVSIAVIIIPSFYYLWKQKALHQMINQFKIK